MTAPDRRSRVGNLAKIYVRLGARAHRSKTASDHASIASARKDNPISDHSAAFNACRTISGFAITPLRRPTALPWPTARRPPNSPRPARPFLAAVMLEMRLLIVLLSTNLSAAVSDPPAGVCQRVCVVQTPRDCAHPLDLMGVADLTQESGSDSSFG